MKNLRNALLTIVAIVALFALFAVALYLIPADNCERVANAMQRPYIFDPINGCYIQTVQDNWQRIDAPNQYQP